MKIFRSIIGLSIVLGLLTFAFGDTPRHIGRAATVNGILVRMDGHDLIVRVKQPNGEAKEVTFPTDDNTEVRIDGDAGSVDDLRADMAVQVVSAIRNVPGPARLVRATSKSLSGAVLRLEGRNLIVRAQDKEVAVETDGRTQITPSELRLEDIKPGMRVKVTPDSGVARKILVTPGAKAKSGK